MIRQILKIKYLLPLCFFIISCSIVSINIFLIQSTKSYIYPSLELISEKKVGIIFGAKVKANGIPSDILADRLDGSIDAYKNGKIQKILVSGDNSKVGYDEPTAMKNYLVSKGIKEADIFIDYAGFDTYDTLYRAREIFSVTGALLFTQSFHLPRALFIARNLGIDALGYPTDFHRYLSETKNNFRESLARVKAWFDVKVWHSKPKFLGEKIPIL